MSLLDDFRRMNEQLKALPEPLAYIVLDHSMRRADKVAERDGHGKKYLRVPPSIMDTLSNRRGWWTTHQIDIAASLTGVPVYRREDMPEGWPYVAPMGDREPS